MAVESNKTIPDDEIDFKSLGSKVFSVLTYPISLLLNNIKTTLVFVIAAVILSISLKFFIKKTYKSDFIIRPIEGNERTHLKMLDDIHKLLKLKDYNSLSKELNISESMLKTIANITITNYTYAKNKADSSNTTSIELELTDNNQLLPMQNVILSYLENNPFLAKMKAYRKINLELKSKLIEDDLVLLDSLKKMQLSSYDKLKITEQNSVFLKDLINPTTTYGLALERVNQKAGLIAQSMFSDNFQLVKGVVATEKPSWPPRILVLCMIFVPIFLVLCFVFLLFKTRSGSIQK